LPRKLYSRNCYQMFFELVERDFRLWMPKLKNHWVLEKSYKTLLNPLKLHLKRMWLHDLDSNQGPSD
jgi:hypothetical protein